MSARRAGSIRVGFVADALGTGGGIERYTAELLRGLDCRDDVEVVVAAPPHEMGVVRDLAPKALGIVEIRGRGQVGRALWERQRLGAHLDRLGVDVVHGMKHLLPRTRTPTVLTAYDVTLLNAPEQYPVAKRMLLPRQYRSALARATVVIAISETTRRRLAELDTDLRSIVVVPTGMSSALTDVVATPLTAVGDRRFALVVGDLSPRKNIDAILDIWEDVHAAVDLVLVVAGPDGWRSTRTRRRIDDFVARGLVVRPGRVTDAELRWCYEQAAVVVYPSVEEGFGLPVAEALVFGATVVASTDDALVEVGRGRPTHVQADDRAGWRAAIIEAAHRGRTDADPFPLAGWSETVEGTVAAYELALRGGGPA